MKKTDQSICQSCGMPLHKIADFGTYEDGSLHADYCHFCYKDGRFTDSDITMEEKIAKNIAMAVNMGMPEKDAVQLANSIIPKLKRWRS